MKPERSFTAARALARHCPELLRPAPPPVDAAPLFAAAADRLARALANRLAAVMGGEAPDVRAETPRECDAGQFLALVPPLAANSVIGIAGSEAPVFASFEAEAVLRLVDRAFGGRGEAPSPLPEAFPLSAELMVKRIETLTCDALAQALDLTDPQQVEALARSGSAVEVWPFATPGQLVAIELEITEANGTTWAASFVFPTELLAGQAGEPAPGKRAVRRAMRPISDAPLGEIPLSLSAVLVDMPIAFSTLAALRPGQILPVALARNVPLRIGERVIAHGAIGALDERVAVQVTQAF